MDPYKRTIDLNRILCVALKIIYLHTTASMKTVFAFKIPTLSESFANKLLTAQNIFL